MGSRTRSEQRQLARSLRAGGRSWVEIAYALRSTWPELNVRAAIRIAHDWSQADAAEVWNELWPDHPKSANDIGLWEVRRPGFATFDKLARLYECSVADLVADLGYYGHLDAANRRREPAGRARSLLDEWRVAEERLVGYWSGLFEDRGAGLWRDRRSQALGFWQLAGLYATTDVGAEVLADVAMQVQLRGVWSTIEAGRDQPEELLTERGRGLLLALGGILARQVGRLDEADRLLSEALAVPAFGGRMARLAQYYLAETRDVHVGDPAPLFLGLTEIDDRIGLEARIAYAHSLTRAGDLAGALAVAREFPADVDDPEFRYRLEELLGVIWLFAGQFAKSAEHFEASRQVAENEDSVLFEALGLRHLALALCWTEPTSVLAQIDEAERLNRDLNLQPGIGQCLLARAVALAGTVPLAEVDAILDEADTVFTEAGYYDDALGAPAVGVFAAAVAGDDELAQQRRQALLERSHGRRPRSWLAAVDTWTGHTDHLDQVTWPQHPTQAHTNWTQPLHQRQAA